MLPVKYSDEKLVAVAAGTLVRLPEPIDLHGAFGRLRRIVQASGCSMLDRHFLVGRLPRVGAIMEAFKAVKPTRTHALGGACLARAVGDIGIDCEMEHRFVLLRHLGVGLRSELDGEFAVGVGRG